MAERAGAALDEHLWTIAIARLLFAPSMNIQAPPNLSPGALRRLIDAGINDWGGVSPVTPDHVNPEAPWPHLEVLERATSAAGKQLRRAARDLSGLCARRADAGSIRRCGTRCCSASMPTAGRAPTTGRRERAPRCRTMPPRRRQPRAIAGETRADPGERAGRRARSDEADIVRLFQRARRRVRGRLRGRRRAAARRSTATSSPTSSPATSITPTSATSNASSAPSPKAS